MYCRDSGSILLLRMDELFYEYFDIGFYDVVVSIYHILGCVGEYDV